MTPIIMTSRDLKIMGSLCGGKKFLKIFFILFIDFLTVIFTLKILKLKVKQRWQTKTHIGVENIYDGLHFDVPS